MADGKLRALDPTLYPIESLEDAFYQKNKFVERFYELITKSIEPPFAISVDGLWGSGKTTLMKLLQKRLQDNYSTFWFNPWEYRKTDSVVLAFLQNLAAEHQDEINELTESGGKIFKVLLKLGIGEALKIYTKGNVSLGDIEKDLKEIEAGQATSYENYRNGVETVKKEFKELINRIGAKYSEKKVIIFFDDLDRCLPDDAIQLLEAVKNLFVIQGCQVIFICGIDTRVAKKFIGSHYKGLEENFAINYFRKIFNLTISMPYQKSVYAMLADHIKPLYTNSIKDWNDEKSDALAKMIYTRGLQAEISRARTYLNIVHNLYAFLRFNPNYQFNQESDAVLHLLVVKEAWQSLYETLGREALKNRLETMGELVGRLLTEEQGKLASEQTAFLQHYFVDSRSPFSRMVFADLLFDYPTLA